MIKSFLNKIFFNRFKKDNYLDNKHPKNIGFIMDGNRRWAEIKNLSLSDAYEAGGNKLLELLIILINKKIETVSVFALAMKNFKKRPKAEMDIIFNTGFKFIEKKEDFFIKNNIKIKFIGNISLLNDELKNKIINLENKTKDFNKIILNFLFLYSELDDILESTKKLALKVKNNEIDISEINEIMILENLRSFEIPQLDIVFRTGDSERLSGFLPIQSAHSEIIFIKKMWPDLNEKYIEKTIESFKYKRRPFGA